MSKRAPSADTVPVRRATQPSTASRTSATAGQRHQRRHRDRPAERVRDQRGNAADEGGPGQGHLVGRAHPDGARAVEPAGQRQVGDHPATDPDQPAEGAERNGCGKRDQQRKLREQADRQAGSNLQHRAPVSIDVSCIAYGGNTQNATVRFIRTLGRQVRWGMTRSRSGCASPASARSGRSSSPNPDRTTSWSAPRIPG